VDPDQKGDNKVFLENLNPSIKPSFSYKPSIENIPGGLDGLAARLEAIATDIHYTTRSNESLHATFHVSNGVVGWSKFVIFDRRD